MATVESDIFKPSKFGGKYTVTLIPGTKPPCLPIKQLRANYIGSEANAGSGDGIGAEVSESVREIFKADNVPVEWEQVDVSGMEEGDKHTEDLLKEAISSLKRNKIGLKGAFCPSNLLYSEVATAGEP